MAHENQAGINGVPLYRQVADRIIGDIAAGRLSPGQQLPTVRSLAREAGLSQGTAKHVYDVLEREGHVVKEQGRGTFVRAVSAPTGSKEQAMAAIDRLLDDMRALSFGWQETRIFFDLKLRQREQETAAAHIAAVDCNPEALAMMRQQILRLPRVEVDSYLLPAVTEGAGPFDPQADLVVTTAAHHREVAQRLAPGRPAIPLVMSLETETAVELSTIPQGARVGLICKSRRFAQIVLDACAKYRKPGPDIQVALLGDAQAVGQVADRSEVLILAPNHSLFASPAEAACLGEACARTPHILYGYQVEQGSMVYLESQVAALGR